MVITKMDFKYDDYVGAISGIIGSILAINLADINWDSIMLNIGQLLWLGLIALFSGAMGVLGKYIINRIIKKYTKK